MRSHTLSRFIVAFLCLVHLACSSDDGGGGPDPIAEVPVDETIALPGLGAAVEVVTDELGIVHIYGPDERSVTFVQGYETAKSRFWEMDAFRRVATGRLSEIFGNFTIGSDVEMRTFFTTRDGRRLEDALWEHVQEGAPDVAQLIQDYTNGVNAWLADVRAGRNGATMPAEYTFAIISNFTADDIDNWRPQDTLAVGRLQAQNLSDDSGSEIGRAERMRALPEEIFRDVYRSAPATNATIIPAGAQQMARAGGVRGILSELPPLEVLASVRRALDQTAAMNPVTRGSEFVGSNNWIVAPSMSESGHAMMANDPHLAHFNPPIWHMVHLETGDGLSASGVNFPGLAGVILGFNNFGAWGATTSNMDVTDIYVEEITTPEDYPASPRTVLFNGEQVPVQRVVERIRIRNSEGEFDVTPLPIDVVPHHGPNVADPNINDDLEGLAATGMTVRWAGHEITLDAVFLNSMIRSRNVDEFKQAIRSFAVGGQNWIWADINGDIAYFPFVLVPQRPAGAIPYLPMPGTGEAEWLTNPDGSIAWLSEESFPQAVNPAEGYLASSNNDHNGNTLDNDPLNDEIYLSYANAIGFRQERILDLLSNDAGVRPAGAKMTLADMSAYQYDNVSLEASRLLPFLFAAADNRPDLVTAAMQSALTRLREWGTDKDGSPAWNMLSGVDAAEFRDDLDARAEPVSAEEVADSIATSIFVGWSTRLGRAVFTDDFAGTGVGRPGGSDATKALLHILEDIDRSDPGFVVHTKGDNGESTLWDDKNTAGTETRDEILLTALRDGLAFLAGAFATDDVEQWQWGKIHGLSFQHFFGQAGVPNFDLGPFAAPGGRFTVNPASYSLNSDSFNFNGGPSMRLVVELDPAGVRAFNSLPGGNFGNPGELITEVYNRINPDLHYGDLTARYLNGETFEIPFTRQQVAAVAESKVLYDPAPADQSAQPLYQGPGPFTVGVRTLLLGVEPDRNVEIWYPAVDGSEAGMQRASYESLDSLPDNLVEPIREAFPELNSVIEMTAYRDLPVSQEGPFPILLFSHGFGGFRQANSLLCAGIASWGFIVASTDHLERGLAEVALPGTHPGDDRDEEDLLAMIELLEFQNVSPGSPFEGAINADLVATSGHSAGGGASFGILENPRIDAAIGFAGTGAATNESNKPVMLVAAAGDIAVTEERVREAFAALNGPKRMVIVAETGHNSFTDQCPGIRELGGLSALPLPIPPDLVRLGDDGCSDLEYPAELSYAIWQHFSVAHLRDAFGIDEEPLGLGAEIANAFDVEIDYTDVP